LLVYFAARSGTAPYNLIALAFLFTHCSLLIARRFSPLVAHCSLLVAILFPSPSPVFPFFLKS